MSSAKSAVKDLRTVELKKSYSKILNHETRTADDEENNDKGMTPVRTDEEIQTAINKLKKGKASHNNGLRAEDIKTCDDATKEMIKQISNEVLKQESCTPETWRRIRTKVIHKKGIEEDVGNYRPICTLPALCKLFSNDLLEQTLS